MYVIIITYGNVIIILCKLRRSKLDHIKGPIVCKSTIIRFANIKFLF